MEIGISPLRTWGHACYLTMKANDPCLSNISTHEVRSISTNMSSLSFVNTCFPTGCVARGSLINTDIGGHEFKRVQIAELKE